MADHAMAAIVERMSAGEVYELADVIVARYRDEIVDYAASDGRSSSRREVLAGHAPGRRARHREHRRGSISPTAEQLEEFRELLARRPHQGVALPSIQHAFRIFGEHLFAELSACASPDRPEELQAAIRGGAVIMRFAHEVIRVVTQAYLDELEDVRGDREIVSRSLLDAVLAGRATAAVDASATRASSAST